MRPSLVGIIVVLVLVAIQQGTWVCEPWIFGRVIDDVIPDTDASGQSLPRTWNMLYHALPWWLLVFAVNTIAGGVLRIASERVYGRMYARVAEGLATRAKESKVSVAVTASRAELGRELVAFFEERVPAAMTDFVSLVGVLIALYTYDWRISAACFTILVPLFFVLRAYDRNVSRLTEDMNALREQNTTIFANEPPEGVLGHFNKVADIKRSIGTWNSINFGALRGALLVVFVAVLYVSIDLDGLSTGDVFAIVTYIWTYVTAIESIPDLLENLTSVRDVRKRLQPGNIEADEPDTGAASADE